MEKLLRIFHSFDIVSKGEKTVITPFKSAEDGDASLRFMQRFLPKKSMECRSITVLQV